MSLKNKKLNFTFGRVSNKSVTLFIGTLATMLRSGLSITEAMDILETQAKGKLKKIISDTSNTVNQGNTLSGSFEKHKEIFSAFVINSIRAGEASGNLDESLTHVAEELEKENELKSKIKAAMVYPSIVLIISFVLGVVVSFVVLPKITPIFRGLKVDLPLSTRVLIFVSNEIQERGSLILILLCAIIGVITWLTRQKFVKPFSHWLFLRLPIIKNIGRNKNLAQFSLAMGSLLKSGLQFDQAVAITSHSVNNYHYQRALHNISKQAEKGNKLSTGLEQEKDLFPELLIGLVRVGEQSGKLEEELFNLNNIYSKEVDRSIKTLSTAMEPMLLVIIGLVVGWLALSIITPIYQITGNVY